MWRRLGTAEDGASAIEYCLLATLVALAAVGAISGVGTASKNNLDKLSETWCAKHLNGQGKGPTRCR